MLEVAANVAQILSVVGPFLVFLFVLGWRIMKKLDAIGAEQKPNHGTSLRDAVDESLKRIDRLEDKLDSRLSKLEQGLASLRGSYDEHTRLGKG